MKLSFKTLALLAATIFSLQAREVIVITYKKGFSNIEKMKKTIQDQFKIPEKLFTFKEIDGNPCETISKESFLHLCIEGENVRTLHTNNQVLINSFSVFSRKESK